MKYLLPDFPTATEDHLLSVKILDESGDYSNRSIALASVWCFFRLSDFRSVEAHPKNAKTKIMIDFSIFMFLF
jgi:hypothetical protein